MSDYDFLEGISSNNSKFNTFIGPSKTFHQLGILVLDGSGSMEVKGSGNLQLAEIVERAVSQLIDWFQSYSTIKNNISLAIVTFDDTAQIHTPATPIVDISPTGRFNPLEGHGGGTEIASGLTIANELATQHLNDPEAENIPHSAVIVLMSDGLTNNEEEAIAKAAMIKQDTRITICSTLFENPHPDAKAYKDEARQILIQVASSPDEYRDTHDPEELRKFFISSLSARQKYPQADDQENDTSFQVFDD